ncbi:MAG: MarR family transcriptional regulator [Thaumarchaeota archaeon]|nr:MAG: MarR family transcriptional regulator [Nitrososphaerota archaeon]
MRKLDLSDSLGMLVFLTSKSLERLAEAEMKKRLGLTSSQWKIIMALNLSDGLSQKELAEKIYVDGSTLVPIIDKMELDGLVERRQDPNDRRNNRIFLTKKSGSVVDSIIEIILELRKIIYNELSQEELESAKKTMKKIIDNADTVANKAM